MAYLGQRARISNETSTYGLSGVSDAAGDGIYTVVSGPPGPVGPPGPAGPQGLVGLPGFHSCECKTRATEDNYSASLDDYYIGCISNQPICITLPAYPDRSVELVIKDEAGDASPAQPITVSTTDGSTIDGSTSYQITRRYGWLTVVWRSNNWHRV